MAVALGNASRPSFDAAGAMLENKAIESRERIARAQIAAQKQAQAMQLGQSLLRMANDNAQQQAQIEAQQQRDQMQLAERQRQEAMANQSAVERQFFQMEAQLKARNEAANKNNLGPHPDSANLLRELKMKMDQYDQALVEHPEARQQIFQEKIKLLQRQAAVKYDVPIKTPEEIGAEAARAARASMIGVDENGNRIPGQIAGFVDPKGVFHEFKPEVKEVDPNIALQKQALAVAKLEMDRIRDYRTVEKEVRNEVLQGEDGGRKYTSDEAVQNEVRKRFGPMERAYVGQGLTPLPEMQATQTPHQQNQRARDIQTIQDYGRLTPQERVGGGPALQRVVREAESRLQQAPTGQGAGQQSAIQPSINGKPVTPLAQYVLGRGAGVGQEEFLQDPISQNYVANSIAEFGDTPTARTEAFKSFDADRIAIIKSMPRVEAGQFPANAQLGSLFLNENHEIVQVPTGARQQRPTGGSGGGHAPFGSSPRPQNMATPSGGAPPQMQRAAPAPQQQPNQPAAPRGLTNNEIFGENGQRLPDPPKGEDGKPGEASRALLFLIKGDPASEKFLNEVLPKMSPQEQAGIYVETLDKNDPASRWDLADKYKVGSSGATMVREEWNGLGYEVTGTTRRLETHGVVAGFMQPIGAAPPNGQPRDRTEVYFEKGSPAEQKWQKEFLPRLSPQDRQGLTVHSVDRAPRGPDTRVNQGELERLRSLEKARNHNFDPKQGMLVIRGKYDPQSGRYLENNSATSETLKSWREFKEFVRPSHEKSAEMTAELVDDNDKRVEAEKVAQGKTDAVEREMWRENFDENVARSGQPIVAGMPVPQQGEKGFDNFQRALREWQGDNARTPASAEDVMPAGATSVPPQSLTDEFQRAQFNQRGRSETQSAPFKMTSDREALLRAYDESKSYGEALNRESIKIPAAGRSSSDIAKQAADNLKKQGIYPPVVMPRVQAMLNEQRRPSPGQPSRIKLLEQQLQKLKAEDKKETAEELKQKIDKNRIEAERLQSPMSVPSTGRPMSSTSPQSMRTNALMQPFIASEQGVGISSRALFTDLERQRQNFNATDPEARANRAKQLLSDYSSVLDLFGGSVMPQSTPQSNGPSYSSGGGYGGYGSASDWARGIAPYQDSLAGIVPGYAGNPVPRSQSVGPSNLNIDFSRAEWSMPGYGDSSIMPSGGDYLGSGYEGLDFSVPFTGSLPYEAYYGGLGAGALTGGFW